MTLESIYQSVVTRTSFNDYINHADNERDNVSNILRDIRNRQSDIDKNLSTRIGKLEGQILRCNG